MSNTVAVKSWWQRFSIANEQSGSDPVIKHYPVAASKTIRVGDPVIISSGEISPAVATSGALLGISVGAVVTTAADEKTSCPVAVGCRQNHFMGQADGQTDGIDEGSECDIIASGTKWLADIGSSTEGVLLIIKKVPGDDETDSTYPGRVIFAIKRSQYDALVAAK